MKTKIFESEIQFPDGEVLQINAGPKNGCYVEILEKTRDQLSAMLSHHNKVLVVIMLFHVNDHSADNTLFSKFIRKLRKRLSERYDCRRMGYIWVRELGKRGSQHYHLALFLNGSKVQSSHSVFDLCVKIWEGWNQPRPSFSARRCYYLLRRGDYNTYAEAFYHLSYLAKTKTKGNRPSATNDYSTSRIKTKPMLQPIKYLEATQTCAHETMCEELFVRSL